MGFQLRRETEKPIEEKIKSGSYASADDVGGNEVDNFGVPKALHDAVSQDLRQVAVHRRHAFTFLAELTIHLVREPLPLAEDDTLAWLLALDGWLQGPRAHGPVERPRVPLLERRHVQIPADPLPELLRRLGHGHR